MSDVSYPPVDTSTLMPRSEAEGAINGFETRIAALEAKKTLSQVYSGTVGETSVLSLALGIRRYPVTATVAVATTDKLVAVVSGIPSNGSLQDVYVSASNTISVGVLTPTLGIGAVISIPIVVYKVI